MPDTSPPRVQFVISGKFIALLLIACALLAAGYYWYNRQQLAQQHVAQIREHFKAPPYFVNSGTSVVRSCYQCFGEGRLKPQVGWKVSPPKEIPDTEHRWFMAVEDPPVPVTVSGVLMLPVHPAWRDNPAFGFDLGRVELVLYQNLQRMNYIEQPPAAVPAPPPAVEPPAPPVSTDPAPVVPPSQPEAPTQTDPPPQPNADPPPTTLPPPPPTEPKVVVTGQHTWTVTLGDSPGWFDTGIPLIAEQRLTIDLEGGDPANRVRLWSAKVGFAVISPVPPNVSLQKDILETDQSIPGSSWLDSLRLRNNHPGSAAVRLVIRTEYLDRPRQMHVYQNDRPGAWDSHLGQHQVMRVRAELAIGRMKTQ
jgi:hypothetical protein